MPIVTVHMLPGRSRAAKRALLKNVTAAVASSLDVSAEKIRVIIHEVPFCHWGIAGVPADEYRAGNARAAGKKVRKQKG